MLLFADAEFAEDEIENVIACCSARQGVEGVKSLIKIKKNHLVGDNRHCSLLGSIEGKNCLRNRLLLAEIGEERSLGAEGFSGEEREDGLT